MEFQEFCTSMLLFILQTKYRCIFDKKKILPNVLDDTTTNLSLNVLPYIMFVKKINGVFSHMKKKTRFGNFDYL